MTPATLSQDDQWVGLRKAGRLSGLAGAAIQRGALIGRIRYRTPAGELPVYLASDVIKYGAERRREIAPSA